MQRVRHKVRPPRSRGVDLGAEELIRRITGVLPLLEELGQREGDRPGQLHEGRQPGDSS